MDVRDTIREPARGRLPVAPDGITLSADILAEIIHPPTFDSKTRIAALVALPMRLGIQMQQFVEDVRDLPPEQLQRTNPFAEPGSAWERGATSLLHELADSSQPIRADVQKWAENVKNRDSADRSARRGGNARACAARWALPRFLGGATQCSVADLRSLRRGGAILGCTRRASARGTYGSGEGADRDRSHARK